MAADLARNIYEDLLQGELRWVLRAYFCPDAQSCDNGGWIRDAVTTANDVDTQTNGTCSQQAHDAPYRRTAKAARHPRDR